MIKKKLTSPLLLIFLFSLLVTDYSLYGQSNRYENQIIEQLEISITNLPPAAATPIIQTVIRRMKTREGDVFSQTAFDSDLKMLSQDYDRIDPQVQSIQGRIYITIKIWPNPTIRRIFWEGNHQIKSKKLHSELGISEGTAFDRQRFNQAFHQVKSYYIKKGYFEAQLDYCVDYDESANEVDVVISINEGRSGKIKKIVLCNFTKREEEEILEMMVTKKYNFFLSWITGEGNYNEDMIQHDQFIILNYLQNQGYADAKIDIQVCEARQKNRIIIKITADRGQHYCFGDITLEGNKLFSDEELHPCIKACSGRSFSPDAIHDTIQRITNRYGKCGYIESVINYEPKLRPDSCIYDVNITIDEGEQYYVGLLKVFGNCSTQTKVILHECLLVPGEVFNLEKLQRTERRLCNIGYFKNVNVYAVKSEDTSVLSSNYRDVHIEVEETNTGHMGAFFGFSTVENMFGGINLTERNFNGCGLWNFCNDGFRGLRGGGEYLHISLSLGAKSTNYGLSWTKPHFLDTPWSVGFDLEKSNTEYISDDYEIKSYGLTLHSTYDCNAFIRVGTHYRLRYTDVDVDEEDAGPKLQKAAETDGLISAIGATWLYDSTNHPIRPTCGFKSRIEGEVAGLWGDHQFLSVAYLNSYYYDVWGKGVLKFRGDFRFIQPLRHTQADNIPLDERFFLGGDNTIRGYRSYRLGPNFDNDKEQPKGGISMQIYSIEYSKCIFSRMDAFVFADAGSLSMDNWSFGKYYYSVGYGCRLQVFENAPPLMLGMGYPLNAPHNNDIKRFFITVGGKF